MKRTAKDPLVTLERLWRQREDRIRHVVLAAQGQAGGLKTRVELLRRALAGRSEIVRSALDGGEIQGETGAYWRHVGDIRGELLSETRRLTLAEQVLASRRVELAGAIRQRRALHGLLQRRGAAGAAERQRWRQKEMDDLHAARAARSTATRTSWPENFLFDIVHTERI